MSSMFFIIIILEISTNLTVFDHNTMEVIRYFNIVLSYNDA